MDLDLRTSDLKRTEQDLKVEKQLSSGTRKAYDNYRNKTEEKYGEKEIEKFLFDMRGIGELISASTDHLVNIANSTIKTDDPSEMVHESMDSFASKMLEVKKRMDGINIDKVKELLSKGFYLTSEELEFGTSLPRDAFSQPYDILRKSQSRLTRTWKKTEKQIQQTMENGSDEQKEKIVILEQIAKGMKQIKVQYDKYKRHLVSFAIAVEPILDEKAKGYFRGIR